MDTPYFILLLADGFGWSVAITDDAETGLCVYLGVSTLGTVINILLRVLIVGMASQALERKR